MNQSELEAIHVTGAKRGKTPLSKQRSILAWLLIGWETGASFANQSHSVVKQNQGKNEIRLYSTLYWNPLYFTMLIKRNIQHDALFV